jgi:hypothetical protein
MAKEYNISKTSGQCNKCEKQLAVGQEFVAVVKDVNDDLSRLDFCKACWDALGEEGGQADPAIVGIWHTKVPQAQEKKRQFVDNELLVDFFTRTEGAQDATKVSFRYVLALVLMRKKLLVYDGMQKDAAGAELWLTHLRGSEQAYHVIDPKMDEDKIAEVGRRLDEILPSNDDHGENQQ